MSSWYLLVRWCRGWCGLLKLPLKIWTLNAAAELPANSGTLWSDTGAWTSRQWRHVSSAPRFHHTKQRCCLHSDSILSVLTCACCHLAAHKLTTGVGLGLGLKYGGGGRQLCANEGSSDGDGQTKRAAHWYGEVCLCACVCSPPLQSHTISTSAAHRWRCNNNITHLISSAYFASPTTPSLHIYHIHLIFRNKCSRKRIMHLPYAPFITDTFTWGGCCRGFKWSAVCRHFSHLPRRGAAGRGSRRHISAISERW